MIVKYPTDYGLVAFDLSRKNLLVSCSGGMDSSTTLYGLAQAISEHGTDNIIQPVTLRKVSNAAENKPKNLEKNIKKPEFDKVNNYVIVDGIVEYVRSKFPTVTINEPRRLDIKGWWEKSSNISQQKDFYVNVATSMGSLSDALVYNGDTCNPDEVIGFEYDIVNFTRVPRNADPTRVKLTADMCNLIDDTISVTMTDYFYDGRLTEFFPFRNFDKRAVMSFIDTYGDLGTYLKITRSCEGDRKTTKNFTVTCPGVTTCWWCAERKWALETYKKDKATQ